MIDCEKCREMISCLLDGELSQAEQSLVREHIASCPECRSVYDAFSAVSEQMHEEEPLPEELHEKIMSGIKAKPKKKTGIVWIKYLSVAACLALVIFAGAKSGMFGRARPITRSALMTVSSLILCSFILMTAAPMPITETELLPPQVRRRRYAICSMHAQGNKK